MLYFHFILCISLLLPLYAEAHLRAPTYHLLPPPRSTDKIGPISLGLLGSLGYTIRLAYMHIVRQHYRLPQEFGYK